MCVSLLSLVFLFFFFFFLKTFLPCWVSGRASTGGQLCRPVGTALWFLLPSAGENMSCSSQILSNWVFELSGLFFGSVLWHHCEKLTVLFLSFIWKDQSFQRLQSFIFWGLEREERKNCVHCSCLGTSVVVLGCPPPPPSFVLLVNLFSHGLPALAHSELLFSRESCLAQDPAL